MHSRFGLDVKVEDSKGFILEKNLLLSAKRDGRTLIDVNGSVIRVNYTSDENTNHIIAKANIINDHYVMTIVNAHLINAEEYGKVHMIGRYMFANAEEDGEMRDLYFEIMLIPNIKKNSDMFAVAFMLYSKYHNE